MATTRQLCRLLQAHLGVDVVPHAARLVRPKLISRRDEDADASDAAYLLLAAMAAPTPDGAIEAVEAVANLSLISAWCRWNAQPGVEWSGQWLP